MLTSLVIKNFILIEDLNLDLKGGLSALTGETGAGKSILLDALGFVLGGRGEASLVRKGAENAAISAEFDLKKTHACAALLDGQGLEFASPLILRRILSTDGRSRAFINDQPVSIGLLKEIGGTLVEIHGQFETHGLLDPKTHRTLLDGFGRHEKLLGAVSASYRAWRDAAAAHENALHTLRSAKQNEEFLRFAVTELDELAPEPGETDRLSELRARLMNREKIAEAMAVCDHHLTAENGVEEKLSSALLSLTRAGDKAGGAFDKLVTRLETAVSEVAEAVAELESVSALLTEGEHDPNAVEERLFALKSAARKHNCLPDQLAEKLESLKGELALVEHQDEQLSALEKDVAKTNAAYQKSAEALSAARKIAAGLLDKAVMKELAPLKLEKAKFVTRFEPLSESGADGIDHVTFMVATNPGSPEGALNKIASGGELARFMLALKVVLAGTAPAASLVFDEVDSGISGATADAVGERLYRLATKFQVLVVTHSPQVAARATHHLNVAKSTKNNVTRTTVFELSKTERCEEIARMLSGSEITQEARAAAGKLMNQKTAAA